MAKRKIYSDKTKPIEAICKLQDRAIALLASQGINTDILSKKLIFDISTFAVDFWMRDEVYVSSKLFDSTLASIVASVELITKVVKTGEIPKSIDIITQ